MKKNKNKTLHRAKTYANLSLQFYKTKSGQGGFLITSNPDKDGRVVNPMDDYVFAKNLVESELVDLTTISFLCKFFRLVEAEIHEKFPRSKLI